MASRWVALQPRRPAAGLAMEATPDEEANETGSDADNEDTADASLTPPPALVSWGDVFDIARLRRSAGDDRQLATVTSRVTLLGTGRLNVRRADEATTLAVVSAAVTEGLAQRVTAGIRSDDSAEVKIALRKLVKNDGDREILERLLGQTSQSYSLWIKSTGPRSRRQSLVVRRVDNAGNERTDRLAL